jgi:hypothetical protein
MNYLENPICKLKTNFKFNPEVKKNILAVSFFKMYGGGYKDFKLYVEGFKKLHKIVLNEKKYNFTIRLFIDNSIYKDKELMDMLDKLERVEIVIYSCEKYFESKSEPDYHIGLFGTMVRFFPMFDFPNNDANIVIISDMDDYEYFNLNVDLMKQVDPVQEKKIYLLKSGNLSKNINFAHDYSGHITPYCFASSFISYKRINPEVLIDFLDSFGDKNIDEILKIYGYKLKGSEIQNKIKLYKKFIYGVDENFLNHYLTHYLVKNNIPYAVNFKWALYRIFYFYKNVWLNKKDKEKIKLINYMIDYLLNRLEIKYDKNMWFEKKYKIIDDILYGKDSKLKNKLNYYYYIMFLYFYNNTNYRFLYPKELYQLISKYDLFGIHDMDVIVYYNTNAKSEFEVQIIKKEEFTNEQIKKLKDFSKKHAEIFD